MRKAHAWVYHHPNVAMALILLALPVWAVCGVIDRMFTFFQLWEWTDVVRAVWNARKR